MSAFEETECTIHSIDAILKSIGHEPLNRIAQQRQLFPHNLVAVCNTATQTALRCRSVGEQTAHPKTRSVFSQAVTETRSITVQTDEEDFSEQKAQFKELQSHFFNQIAALETSSAHRIDVLDNRIRSVSQGACNLLTVSDMALCTSNRDEHLHSIMQSSLSEQLQRTVVNLHESEERLKLMMWFHSVCMTQQITSANSNNSTTAHQEIQLAPNGELVALLEECYQALHDTE